MRLLYAMTFCMTPSSSTKQKSRYLKIGLIQLVSACLAGCIRGVFACVDYRSYVPQPYWGIQIIIILCVFACFVQMSS